MTYPDDWTTYENGGIVSFDETTFAEGNASIHMENEESVTTPPAAAVVLDQSLADSPTELEIRSEVFLTDSSTTQWVNEYTPSILFRLQDDSNFYLTHLTILGGETRLFTYIDGTPTQIDSVSHSYDVSGWHPLRCAIWTDAAGDLRVRWYHDDDDDGSYTQIGTADLIDTAPEFSQGGGIGLTAGEPQSEWRRNARWDQTEVFY